MEGRHEDKVEQSLIGKEGRVSEWAVIADAGHGGFVFIADAGHGRCAMQGRIREEEEEAMRKAREKVGDPISHKTKYCPIAMNHVEFN